MTLLSRMLDSPAGPVSIDIDAPVRDRDDNWYTEYKIKGDKPFTGKVYGSDALQSLMLALDRVRVEVERDFPTAVWLEGDNHGLPYQVPYFLKQEAVDSIKAIVDAELDKKETYK